MNKRKPRLDGEVGVFVKQYRRTRPRGGAERPTVRPKDEAGDKTQESSGTGCAHQRRGLLKLIRFYNSSTGASRSVIRRSGSNSQGSSNHMSSVRLIEPTLGRQNCQRRCCARARYYTVGLLSSEIGRGGTFISRVYEGTVDAETYGLGHALPPLGSTLFRRTNRRLPSYRRLQDPVSTSRI